MISEFHVTVSLFYNLMPIISIDISPTPKEHINMLLVCDICIEIEINACYDCHKRICGALVQFGCYQHRYELGKGSVVL